MTKKNKWECPKCGANMEDKRNKIKFPYKRVFDEEQNKKVSVTEGDVHNWICADCVKKETPKRKVY